MHAIVMVHKMQSMTLSNHQLIPTKAESPCVSGDCAAGTPEAAGDSPLSQSLGSPEPSLAARSHPHHHINVT